MNLKKVKIKTLLFIIFSSSILMAGNTTSKDQSRHQKIERVLFQIKVPENFVYVKDFYHISNGSYERLYKPKNTEKSNRERIVESMFYKQKKEFTLELLEFALNKQAKEKGCKAINFYNNDPVYAKTLYHLKTCDGLISYSVIIDGVSDKFYAAAWEMDVSSMTKKRHEETFAWMESQKICKESYTKFCPEGFKFK